MRQPKAGETVVVFFKDTPHGREDQQEGTYQAKYVGRNYSPTGERTGHIVRSVQNSGYQYPADHVYCSTCRKSFRNCECKS